jgi:hypothetical protein
VIYFTAFLVLPSSFNDFSPSLNMTDSSIWKMIDLADLADLTDLPDLADLSDLTYLSDFSDFSN